jgi:tetratricopeptide (TPR) repeat protein
MTAYEAGDETFRDYMTTMAAAIDVAKEESRFDQTFSSIPLPARQPVRAEAPPARVVDPVLELLKAAQAVFERDKDQAREVFEKVLRDHDSNNGRALYGLALIEMDRTNLDEALKYFERTIASPSAEPSMKTWAHIYAGHILDFKCDRRAAVEHYRKAIDSGDNTRDAQSIAKRDLSQPFGGECPQ